MTAISTAPIASAQVIKTRVAAEWGVSVIQLDSASTCRDLSHPRWVAMWLMRGHLGWSYPRIGRAVGGRDHTSVLYGLRKLGELMERDADLRARADALLASLEGELPPAELAILAGDGHTAAQLGKVLIQQFALVVQQEARRDPQGFVRRASEWIADTGEAPPCAR